MTIVDLFDRSGRPASRTGARPADRRAAGNLRFAAVTDRTQAGALQ